MQTPARRLSIRDITILIVGLSAAFAVVREFARVDRVLSPSLSLSSWQAIIPAAALVLVALSLTTLAISLLPPRPRLRRLVHRPGFLSGVAVASNVAMQTVQRLVSLSTGNRLSPRSRLVWEHNLIFSLWIPSFVVPCVFLALLIGMLSGFDLRRPDWVEVIARLLGCIWVVFWILTTCQVIGL